MFTIKCVFMSLPDRNVRKKRHRLASENIFSLLKNTCTERLNTDKTMRNFTSEKSVGHGYRLMVLLHFD